MNFGLLWLCALLAALLWVAGLAACIEGFRRKWFRRALLFLVCLGPLIGIGLFVFSAVLMKFRWNLEPSWFGYSVSLLLGYLVGAALILRKARGRQAGLPSAVANWRRAPLGLAWLMVVAVGYAILCNMDLAIRTRCAMTSASINAQYLAALPAIVSDAQNAAPLYEKAFARLEADHEEEEQIQNQPMGIDDKFDPNEPATISFLAHQAATIALLRQAAALHACRFDADLNGPNFELMFLDFEKGRNASRVLYLHAQEEVAHGRVASAIEDAAAIFGMGRHFDERPLLISALVGNAIEGFGYDILEQALAAVKSRDDLTGLHLDEYPALGHVLRQSLRGEEVWHLTLYAALPAGKWAAAQRSSTSGISFAASGVGMASAFFRVFYLDLDGYLGLMENIQNAPAQPYYKIRDQMPYGDDANYKPGLFASEASRILSQTIVIFARAEAADACAQAAVAMTRFRLDHGTLPPRLNDLVPAYLDAVPTDPFNGQPIRLVNKGDRCVIYSVGPDLIDDGGVKIDWTTHKGDVIFTLKQPQVKSTTSP